MKQSDWGSKTKEIIQIKNKNKKL